VALLLTDLVMPSGLTGQELARELRLEHPGLKVIFISGYSGELAGQELHLDKGQKYIQKPCGVERLLETIRQCLDGG
jgi:CheY-like chemotaxis protein